MDTVCTGKADEVMSAMVGKCLGHAEDLQTLIYQAARLIMPHAL